MVGRNVRGNVLFPGQISVIDGGSFTLTADFCVDVGIPITILMFIHVYLSLVLDGRSVFFRFRDHPVYCGV